MADLYNLNNGLLTGLAQGVRGGLGAYRAERDRNDRLRREQEEAEQARGLLQQRLDAQKDMLMLKGLLRGGDSAKADKPGADLTPGQVAADRAFAKSYEEDVLSGANATTERNLGEVESALADLEAGNVTTGGFASALPDFLRDYVDSGAKSNQDRIRQATMATLKATLGAQFTEKEGQRIFELAYNPRQSTQENIRRVRALADQLKNMYSSKQAAQGYFADKGTMKGFKGNLPSVAGINIPQGQKEGLIRPAVAAGKPKTVIQNGVTYRLNESTGEYE